MQKSTVKSGRAKRRVLANISNKVHLNQDDANPTTLKKPKEPFSQVSHIHSDLSRLFSQIEQLIASAKNLDAHDVQCFTSLLSQTHITLQEHVLKLRQLFSKSSAPDTQLTVCQKTATEMQPAPSSSVVLTADIIDPKMFSTDDFENSLSKSPLVSWNPGLKSQSGTLFSLTPCSRWKTNFTDSKLYPVSKSSTSNIDKGEPVSVLMQPSILSHCEDAQNSQAESKLPQVSQFETPNYNVLKSFKTSVSSPKADFLSKTTQETSHRGQCTFAQFTPRSNLMSKKPDEDDFEFHVPKSLIKKYSNLFKDDAEDSVLESAAHRTLLSPPKTCLLLDPSTDSSSESISDPQIGQENVKGSKHLTLRARPTPNKVIVDKDYYRKKARRHPGEETLRKELWSKLQEENADMLIVSRPTCEGKADFMSKLDDALLESTPVTTYQSLTNVPKTTFSQSSLVPSSNTPSNSYTENDVGGFNPKSCPRDKPSRFGNGLLLNSMKKKQVNGSVNTYQYQNNPFTFNK